MAEIQAQRSSPVLPFIVDILERLTLLAAFIWTCGRFLHGIHDQRSVVDTALLISEAAPVFFILTHRAAKRVRLHPADLAATVIGTFCPLLVRPSETAGFLPIPICVALIAAGLLLQIMAKLTLRRSFGLVPANRGIKGGGPYRLLRHPMYAGYIVAEIAFFAAHPTLFNLVIYAIAWIAQLLRILAEERVLSGEQEYRAFMQNVRWRLIPYVF